MSLRKNTVKDWAIAKIIEGERGTETEASEEVKICQG